jgi:hypothetical protein
MVPRISMALLGGWLVACSASASHMQDAQIAQLLAQGRKNELAAIGKYQGEWLRVRGVIAEKGLLKLDQKVGSHRIDPIAGPLGSTTGTTVVGRRRVPHPFLVLQDPRQPGTDVLLCYFSSDDAAAVGNVAVGSTVTVSGLFQEYGSVKDTLELVLNRCKIE